MELARAARAVVNRGRRASAIAVAALPLAFLLLVLVVRLGYGASWRTPLEALGFTGLVLSGPFLRSTVEARGSWFLWIYLTVPWLLVAAWVVASRRTRVGDMHWALHLAIMLIWMMCGIVSIPLV